jgi:ABC-2 type transport system permease protein
MTAIFWRELRAYFNSMVAYVFMVFLLVFAGIYTMAYNLNSGYPNFEYVLQSLAFIFMVAIPILTMRTIAEERRQHTDQLLYALPIGMTRVVLGKYLAMLVVVAAPCLIFAFYPLLLSSFGAVSLSTAYGALFGFFMLAATLSAIGLLVSSLTENQAVAAGLCFVVMLLLYYMSALASYVSDTASASLIALLILVLVVAVLLRLLTRSTPAALILGIAGCIGVLVAYLAVPTRFEGLFGKIMDSLSVFERFYTFNDGVFDLTAIVYFLSIIGVALFLTVQSMEKRRWL